MVAACKINNLKAVLRVEHFDMPERELDMKIPENATPTTSPPTERVSSYPKMPLFTAQCDSTWVSECACATRRFSLGNVVQQK